jgi:hypothetical protein
VSTKFVMFKLAKGNEPILINPAHVRTAHKSGSEQVLLVMDCGQGEGNGHQRVVGDLETVWKLLTGEK